MTTDDDGPRLDTRTKVLRFFGPFGLFFLLIGIILILEGWDRFALLTGLMIAYEFPPAGKESIIPAGILIWDVHWLLMALLVAFMDVITALFLVWNFDYARKIPLLGKWIEKFEDSNADILDRKGWMRKAAFVGLILFVMFPFQGSGGVGGSVLGRVIGMRPMRVFQAITAGAVIGTITIGYITVTVGSALFASLRTTEAKVIGVVIFIAVITVFGVLYNRNKKRTLERERKRIEEEE